MLPSPVAMIRVGAGAGLKGLPFASDDHQVVAAPPTNDGVVGGRGGQQRLVAAAGDQRRCWPAMPASVSPPPPPTRWRRRRRRASGCRRWCRHRRAARRPTPVAVTARGAADQRCRPAVAGKCSAPVPPNTSASPVPPPSRWPRRWRWCRRRAGDDGRAGIGPDVVGAVRPVAIQLVPWSRRCCRPGRRWRGKLVPVPVPPRNHRLPPGARAAGAGGPPGLPARRAAGAAATAGPDCRRRNSRRRRCGDRSGRCR